MVIICLSLVFGLLAAGPAAAEHPAEVLDAAGSDGVVIAESRVGTVNAAELIGSTTRARNAGLLMLVSVPEEALPSTDAFALRLQQPSDYDVVAVIDNDGSVAISLGDDLPIHSLSAAAEQAEKLNGEAAVRYFVDEAVAPIDPGMPPFVRRVLTLAVALSLVAGVLALAEYFLNQNRRRSLATQT